MLRVTCYLLITLYIPMEKNWKTSNLLLTTIKSILSYRNPNYSSLRKNKTLDPPCSRLVSEEDLQISTRQGFTKLSPNGKETDELPAAEGAFYATQRNTCMLIHLIENINLFWNRQYFCHQKLIIELIIANKHTCHYAWPAQRLD